MVLHFSQCGRVGHRRTQPQGKAPNQSWFGAFPHPRANNHTNHRPRPKPTTTEHPDDGRARTLTATVRPRCRRPACSGPARSRPPYPSHTRDVRDLSPSAHLTDKSQTEPRGEECANSTPSGPWPAAATPGHELTSTRLGHHEPPTTGTMDVASVPGVSGTHSPVLHPQQWAKAGNRENSAPSDLEPVGAASGHEVTSTPLDHQEPPSTRTSGSAPREPSMPGGREDPHPHGDRREAPPPESGVSPACQGCPAPIPRSRPLSSEGESEESGERGENSAPDDSYPAETTSGYRQWSRLLRS